MPSCDGPNRTGGGYGLPALRPDASGDRPTAVKPVATPSRSGQGMLPPGHAARARARAEAVAATTGPPPTEGVMRAPGAAAAGPGAQGQPGAGAAPPVEHARASLAYRQRGASPQAFSTRPRLFRLTL